MTDLRARCWLLLVLSACAATPATPPPPLSRAVPRVPASHGACLRLVGWTGPAEQCEARATALGRALWVSVVTGCGGDSCAVTNFVVTGAGAPIQLPDGSGDGVVEPALRFAVYPTVHLEEDLAGDERPGAWTVTLDRYELATGASTRWAACMSPTLSPGGRWIVCRDRDGNAYRAAIDGGGWQRIYRLELGAGEAVDWAPYKWVVPAPVSFPTARRIEIVTGLAPDGEASHVDQRPWTE
jgi:hypothetical protein